MANEEQLEILKQGVDVWNEWREKNFFDEAWNQVVALKKPKLKKFRVEIDLSGADLRATSLSGADLKVANLREAQLSAADLSGSNLSEADLNGAFLNRTDLRSANLSGARLIGANLSGANLRAAILSHAHFGGTVFTDTDLSLVSGLEETHHLGSSQISMHTLRRSKGKISTAFLRGCGLSDLEIEFAKLEIPGLNPEQVTEITYKIYQLYVGRSIQYFSCFISYSSKDQEFAQRLHSDLQNNGVRCWFDREDLKIGDAIRPMIDRQIRSRDKLLVILSENSIKSEWVGDEVEGALEEEQKGSRSVLFPIRLDDTVLNTRDDWAAKIKRRRHIGDFSNWKDKNSYQKAFERLLRDLKASSEIGSKDELE